MCCGREEPRPVRLAHPRPRRRAAPGARGADVSPEVTGRDGLRPVRHARRLLLRNEVGHLPRAGLAHQFEKSIEFG